MPWVSTYRSGKLVLAACEDILESSNKLSEVDKYDENNKQTLEQDFQKIVVATSTIVRYAEEWISEDSNDVLVGFLSMLSIKIRNSVLQFVPATKASLSNSKDYLTKQDQQKSYGDLIKFTTGIKSIIQIFIREGQRNQGVTYGIADASDAEILLVLQLGDDLITESRELINLAVQGVSEVVLEEMGPFLTALQKFLDKIQKYDLTYSYPHQRQLERQKKSIFLLSQIAEELEDDELELRAATISQQIVDDSALLILEIISNQHADLGDDITPTEVVKTRRTPSGREVLRSAGSKRKLNESGRTISGRDVLRSANSKARPSLGDSGKSKTEMPKYTSNDKRDKFRSLRNNPVGRHRSTVQYNDEPLSVNEKPQRNLSDSGDPMPPLPDEEKRTIPDIDKTSVSMQRIKKSYSFKLRASQAETLATFVKEKPTEAETRLNALFKPLDPKSRRNLKRSTSMDDLVDSGSEEIIQKTITPQKRILVNSQTEPQLKTSKNDEISVAATMAATVPVLINFFCNEFNWFSKEWDKLSITTKMNFQKKLHDQLVNPGEPSQEKEKEKPIEPQRTQQRDRFKTISLKPKKKRQRYRTLAKQSSFAPLESQIIRNQNRKAEADLQGMMMPESSNIQWFHRSTSFASVLDADAVQAIHSDNTTLRENITELMETVQNCINPTADIESTVPISLKTQVSDIYNTLLSITLLCTSSTDSKTVQQMFTPTQELLESSATIGTIDEGLVKKLKNSANFTNVQTSLANLRLCTYDKLQNICALVAQTSYILSAVNSEQTVIGHADTLQLLSCTRSIVTTITTSLDLIETYVEIRSSITKEKCKRTLLKQSMDAGESVWKYKPKKDENTELCSLNYMINYITSPTLTDDIEELEKAFILTYRTSKACDASLLLRKLMDRYQVPKGKLKKQEITKVQKRVCNILIAWAEKQFHHIPKHICDRLIKFMETQMVPDGHEKEAERLILLMTDKVIEEKNFYNKVITSTLHTLDLQQKDLYTTFLAADDKAIAEQLTLLDYEIFKRISHSELINQAWTKNKQDAVNVTEYITRLNHVSYWIPSMILYSEKLIQRGDVLSKFVRIGNELIKLNSYNTLMGLIAGLYMSPITRLKYTMSILSKELTKDLEEMTQLMNPQLSFKRYREQISKAERPLIPYLGVSLTDLTFIDEGNSSMKGDYINYGKSVLISKILENIQYYQQVSYNIKPHRVLSIYLKELPSLDSDALYQLSLSREPRGAEMKDIL